MTAEATPGSGTRAGHTTIPRILMLSLLAVFAIAAFPSVMSLVYLRELARSPERAGNARAERIQHDLARIHDLGRELSAATQACDDAARIGEILTALGERRATLILSTGDAATTSGAGDGASANQYLADVIQRIGTLRYLAPDDGTPSAVGPLAPGRCEALAAEVTALNEVARLGTGAFVQSAAVASRSAALRALRNTLLGLAFGMGAAVACAVWAARRIRRPLSVLGRVLLQAADGNYNVAVARTGLHEADVLAEGLGRTLGRLRVFDTLKTRRVREERLLVDALLGASGDDLGVAIINPAGIVSQANAVFRSLVGLDAEACEGHRIDDVLGAESLEVLKRVQDEKTIAQLTWTNGSGPEGDPLSVRLIPVKSEGHGLPRVIVHVSPPSRSRPEPATED